MSKIAEVLRKKRLEKIKSAEVRRECFLERVFKEIQV